ncbi:glutathione synthetase [Flavimarina sp. Hel_I_48]|uniref:glutathione synthetase n=1 Tax=Flavimarina sp. Hel_I_48 TaxID=1392488 RepID=UPI0004DF95D2|nr:glutathione synthetase [Flavimarina sp. Hel_I_48]
MKICYVVSNIKSERCGTTLVLMKKAHERGHTVYVMNVGGFNFMQGSPICICCKMVPENFDYESEEDFLAKMKTDAIPWKMLDSAELDVMFLRNNPTEETIDRHWAERSGLAFARLVQQQGVLVLNDANSMSHSFIDKLYFEELPELIKPDSLITRDKTAIIDFWEKSGKKIVLKPLEGSGGKNIYLIDEHRSNFNQIIKTLTEKGYIIAQKFLPEVSEGDVRVLVMNGKILEKDGVPAIMRRVNKDESEFRSNVSLGGKTVKAELTPSMERIVALTAPKLIRDGFFFVGLDIVKDKLIEINVMSPGGLYYGGKLGLPEFGDTVIEAIERKVEYKALHKDNFSNKMLATMD